MNFGNKDVDGADGIVFVLQNVGATALGISGGGLSYESIDSSLTVEFDNFENANLGDPAYDHIAMQSMGNMDHNGPFNLFAPVPSSPTFANIEDGANHSVEITWDPVTAIFEVYFDCNLRVSTTLNMSDYFGNDPIVFWGFTGSTGGLSNLQTVCLTELVNDPPLSDTLTLCQGDQITLSASPAISGWVWTPNFMISDTTTQSVVVSTPVDTTYYVSYTTACETKTDTFHIQVVPPPTVDLGPDTAVCAGVPVVLNATTPGVSYIWQDNSNLPTFTATASGTYAVTVSAGTCSDSDTVNVVELPSPALDLGPNQSFCAGGQIVLDATTPNATYSWQDNSTQATLAVTASGDYSVTITVAGCQNSDTITVTEAQPPTLDLGPDIEFCSGDSALIVATTNNATYTWQDGSSDPWFAAFSGGTYTVTVTVGPCSVTDAIGVTEIGQGSVNLGPDSTVCHDADLNIALDATTPNASYVWQDGSTGASFLVTAPGAYQVAVTTGCGIFVDSIRFDTIACATCTLFVPNVFTPNNDAINDRLEVECAIEPSTIHIYNRWGNLVFESDKANTIFWDGRNFSGAEVQPGVYYYVITEGPENTTTTGFIEVFR